MELNEYGMLVVIASLLYIFYPLSSAGYEFNLLRLSSQNILSTNHWKYFIYIATASWIAITLFSMLILTYLTHTETPLLCIILISFGEIFCLRYTEGINRIFQGSNNSTIIFKIRTYHSASKLLSISIAICILNEITIEIYSACSCISGIISCSKSLSLLNQSNQINKKIGTKIHEKLNFFNAATAYSLEKFNGSADKIFISNYISNETSAIYATANRLAELISIPLLSFTTLKQADNFKNTTTDSTIKTIKEAIVYTGIIAAPTLLFGAYTINLFLGETYAKSFDYLIALIFTPAIAHIKYSLTTKAMILNKNNLFLMATTVSSITNFLLNLMLVPYHGVNGAILSLYTSEILLIFTLHKLITTTYQPKHKQKQPDKNSRTQH